MYIEIFKDKNGEYRLRLKGENHKIIMSSEAYSSKRKAKQTAYKIRNDMSNHFLDILEEEE